MGGWLSFTDTKDWAVKFKRMFNEVKPVRNKIFRYLGVKRKSCFYEEISFGEINGRNIGEAQTEKKVIALILRDIADKKSEIKLTTDHLGGRVCWDVWVEFYIYSAKY